MCTVTSNTKAKKGRSKTCVFWNTFSGLTVGAVHSELLQKSWFVALCPVINQGKAGIKPYVAISKKDYDSSGSSGFKKAQKTIGDVIHVFPNSKMVTATCNADKLKLLGKIKMQELQKLSWAQLQCYHKLSCCTLTLPQNTVSFKDVLKQVLKF